MSVSEDVVLKLVGMAYDAAMDERQWLPFLEAFSAAVGCSSAMLRAADMERKTATFTASVGYDPACQLAYCSHYVKQDYLMPRLNSFQIGEIKTSDQLFTLSQQRQTEYFNDYSLPHDKVHAMGVILDRDGNRTVTFAVQRGQRGGAFADGDVRVMGVMAPHVNRAVQLHRKLHAISVEKAHARRALDQLRMGVILTNQFAIPLYLNRAAELMMSRGDGVGLLHNRLAVHSPDETAKLHKLIAGASLQATGVAAGGDMRITIPDSGGFLHCLVAPVSTDISSVLSDVVGTDCVALFLTRPEHLLLSPRRLVTVYKITPAEARLSARLIALRTVEEAADDLGIAVSTARSQLKSIFAKTGVKNQSELLMLFATGALAHCRDA